MKVLQGCGVGPMLFNVVISDLDKDFEGVLFKFAGSTKSGEISTMDYRTQNNQVGREEKMREQYDICLQVCLQEGQKLDLFTLTLKSESGEIMGPNFKETNLGLGSRKTYFIKLL